MFRAGFRDLVKPQWVATVGELKIAGGLPVSELARRIDASYMAVKQYCEDLKKLGYLERSRIPRTEVGRPEIFYRLTAKSDVLFPEAGAAFTLDVLESLRPIFGESAPERVLFQYFQHQQEQWQSKLEKANSILEKATLLAGLREKSGCFAQCQYEQGKGFRIEEYHHPLHRVFEKYPRTITMELRMMEQLLGTKVARNEIPGGKAGPARVDYEIALMGQL
jgi:predicted ArsR family transcriptional regulator